MRFADFETLQKFGINITNKDIYNKNKNRKVIHGITIDNNKASFLDDGINLIKKGQNYILQVSIVDISEVIIKDSFLDLNARKILINNENTSLYPPLIKRKVFSLNEFQVSLAITIEITLNSNLDIIKRAIFESAFINTKKYNYNSFDIELNKRNISKNSFISKIRFFTEKLQRKINRQSSLDNASNILEIIMFFINKQITIYCSQKKIPIIYQNMNCECTNKYTLQTSNYSTFTSPMRKYSDMVNLFQIKEYINSEKIHNSVQYTNNELQEIINNLNSFKCSNNLFFKEQIIHIIKNNLEVQVNIFNDTVKKLEDGKVDYIIVYYLIFYLNLELEKREELMKKFISKRKGDWARILFNFIKYHSNIYIGIDKEIPNGNKRKKIKKSDTKKSTFHLEINHEIFIFTQKKAKNERISNKIMAMLLKKMYKYINKNKVNIF